jgi:hypothetical protein
MICAHNDLVTAPSVSGFVTRHRAGVVEEVKGDVGLVTTKPARH